MAEFSVDPWADKAQNEHIIDTVSREKNWYNITFTDGWSIGVNEEDFRPEIDKKAARRLATKGERVTLWGEGVGSPFRGVAFGEMVLWYRTEEEQKALWEENLARQDREDRERWEEQKPDLTARIERLPKILRDRMYGFRERNERWYKYEAYELICTELAHVIFQICPTESTWETLFMAPFDDQEEAIHKAKAGVADHLEMYDMSGNQVEFAFHLARVMRLKPDIVRDYHGGLCLLVGCNEMKCGYAGKDED